MDGVGKRRANSNVTRYSNPIPAAALPRAKGEASIAEDATTVVVTHGLTGTPSVQVTPSSEMTAATKFWVTAVGATTFTINVDTAPGAGNTDTFLWRAFIL
ncbi:MAG: hypothetical protein WD533_06475 [Dehalococcoidia bacterium]